MSWELGEAKVYKPIGPDAVPLSEATIWPSDMPDADARVFAKILERKGRRAIGAVACSGDHELVLPCPSCGAAL